VIFGMFYGTSQNDFTTYYPREWIGHPDANTLHAYWVTINSLSAPVLFTFQAQLRGVSVNILKSGQNEVFYGFNPHRMAPFGSTNRPSTFLTS